MFFHLPLDKDIEVEPRFFGPRLQEILKQKITAEVNIFAEFMQAVAMHFCLGLTEYPWN